MNKQNNRKWYLILLIMVVVTITLGACSSVKAQTEFSTVKYSVSGAPSEEDVQTWVKDYEEEINPVGGIGSPKSIDLTFNQIIYGETRAANEGDRLRKVKSDQLYMVTVDYTISQHFSDGTYDKHKKWLFEFYINTENGWSAFNYGPAE